MKVLAVALLAAVAAAPVQELKIGDVVKDYAFKSLDKKELKLSDFRNDKEKKVEGKVVVVFFQSQNCPSAVKPDAVRKLVDPYLDPKKPVPVQFISVFAYGHDNEIDVGKLVEQNKQAWPCVWDEGKKFSLHLDAKKVNTCFVLDRDGKLVYRGGPTGKKKEPLLAEAVKAALEGKKAPDSDGKFAG